MGAFDDLIPNAANPHPAAQHPAQGNSAFADLVAASLGLRPQPVDWREHGALGAVDATVRAAANGVPILGPMANRADAALQAAGSYITDKLGGPNNPNQFDVHGASWGDRYNRALAVQDAIDHQFSADHPHAALVAALAGGVAGSLAGAKYLSPATSALQRAAPAAGLIPRAADHARVDRPCRRAGDQPGRRGGAL